jgi:hypothetical protein
LPPVEIEGDDHVVKPGDHLRHSMRVVGRAGEMVDVASGFVSQIADGATEEGNRSVGRRSRGAELRLEDGEGIARHRPAVHTDTVIVRGQDGIRFDGKVAVTATGVLCGAVEEGDDGIAGKGLEDGDGIAERNGADMHGGGSGPWLSARSPLAPSELERRSGRAGKG